MLEMCQIINNSFFQIVLLSRMFKGNLKGALKSLRQFVERGKKIVQDGKINKFVCERKKKE